MAATLLVSAATAGDQSSFGAGGVANLAFGVFPPSLLPSPPPAPRTSGAGASGRAVAFDFSLAPPAQYTGRFDFTPLQRPVTSAGAGSTSAFGTAHAVNAAQSFAPAGIPAYGCGKALVTPDARAGVNFDLTNTRAQSVAVQLNWGPLAVQGAGWDASVLSELADVRAPLSIRPLGIPVPTTTLLPIVSDPSRTGRNVEFNLTAYGQPTATPTSVNFIFGAGAAVVAPPSLDSLRNGPTGIRNAAATIAPQGVWKRFASVGVPLIHESAPNTSKALRFDFYFVQSQTGANVAFPFWIARAANAVGWDSFESGLSAIRNKSVSVRPLGEAFTAVGAPTFLLGSVSVIPAGIFAQQFGNVTTVNKAAVIRPASLPLSWGVPSPVFTLTAQILFPGGIAPPPATGANDKRQLPDPFIAFRIRYLTGAGGINAFVANNSHYIAQFIQYIDQAGRGIAPLGVGASTIRFRTTTVYPTFVPTTYWGQATVKRQHFITPLGWDSQFISENAELLVNTRRVTVLTGEEDPAGYGVATIFNWRQDIDLHNNGWYDTQWNFPIVYNLKQEVFAAPFADNIDPDEWPHYAPLVENKRRFLRTFGHSSSRVNVSAIVSNRAAPITPEGIDSAQWGADTFIAPRVRGVTALGWESFYNEQYTVVWNAAVAIGPAGAGDTSSFGKPDPVLNLNRTVKQHSGWKGAVWGTPFVAFGVRRVYPSLFYDVPAAFPEVRFNPCPIAPVGIPQQGQVGGHEVVIFRREAFPKSVNVHSMEWVGEPYVRNRNMEVGPYGYDQSGFGVTDVQHFIRYLEPGWENPEFFTPPLIAYRTKVVVPAAYTPPLLPVIHRIRNVLPDPPSPQRIMLDDPDGSNGFGIPPVGMAVPYPVINLATVYPGSLGDVTKFGMAELHTNNLLPRFIFEDGLFGTPTVIFTRFLYPDSISEPGEQVSEHARMTPWNIYAPAGDQAPYGYTPRPWRSSPIYSWAEFGTPIVSNQNRTIGPVPSRNSWGGFDYYPQFGAAMFTLRLQRVFPAGIRSQRTGYVVFLNVPQFVTLDDVNNPQGIAPSTVWGANSIGHPVDPNVYLRPAGLDSLQPGTTRVELFNRTIYPTGTPHAGGSSGTNPWGVPLVGYPRRYTVSAGDMTLWGDNVIEFLNRPVYPEGWINCSLEDDNLDDYRFPMRFTRTNPSISALPASDFSVFGRPSVALRIRTVYSRGIDGYNAGRHIVVAVSAIAAQGWESSLIGDIDRWEAGRIKAHGDDVSAVGTPRMRHTIRQGSFGAEEVTPPRVASGVSPLGILDIAFAGPSVTNPFGCENRVITPLPVLSTQTVPSPAVA